MLPTRSFLEWARRQKRRGRLKLLFRLYDWLRLAPSRWRQSEAAFRACQVAAFVGPDSASAQYAWAKGLMTRYVKMTGSGAYDPAQAIEVGTRAVDCLRRAVALEPERLEWYEPLCSMLSVTGRMGEAVTVLEQLSEMQRQLAEAKQYDRLGIRFVSPAGAGGNIGGLAGLDGYVKAGLLGWRPQQPSFLLLPSGARVSNPSFLDCWRRHITFITDQDAIERLTPVARYLEDPFHLLLNCHGKTLHTASWAAMIQRQWYDEGRPPLLSLSEEDRERGWRCLQKLGMPRDAWFVCLHVREGGFRKAKSRYETFRNADVGSYLLAIQSILARGGWIIRMGDPSMKPLPPMERVIDYVHSDARSDWMDVFLGAECRFFVGTASGLAAVPLAFGVPCLFTNYLPTSAVGFSKQDLFLPKLCWSVREGRLLSFAELMSPPVSTSAVQALYDWQEIKPVDNTPEEINDLTVEMLTRLGGSLNYSEEDEHLQHRFRALTAKCGTLIGLDHVGINCRIGRDFLRRHAALLPGER